MILHYFLFRGQAIQEYVERSKGTLVTFHGLKGHGIAEQFALKYKCCERLNFQFATQNV
jgi:hypothetical protein